MAIVSPSSKSDHSGAMPLGEVDPAALLANADALLLQIQEGSVYWKWPEFPERPEALQSDQEVWTIYRKVDRGEKIGAEDRKQLQLLGSWRSAVFDLETQTGGRLLAIAGCIRTLERAERVVGGERQLCRLDDAEALRHYLRQEFRCRLPVPVPGFERQGWVRMWADHCARNRNLLPDHLRKMTRPPADQGWTRPQPTQGGFGYAESE